MSQSAVKNFPTPDDRGSSSDPIWSTSKERLIVVRRSKTPYIPREHIQGNFFRDHKLDSAYATDRSGLCNEDKSFVSIGKLEKTRGLQYVQRCDSSSPTFSPVPRCGAATRMTASPATTKRNRLPGRTSRGRQVTFSPLVARNWCASRHEIGGEIDQQFRPWTAKKKQP